MTWGVSIEGDRRRFRLWAPSQRAVRLRLDGADIAMQRSHDGWFDVVTSAAARAEYAFVLDNGMVVPDPASREQVRDVHGASRVTEPETYPWVCDWHGRAWEEAVIMELHIGTFTAAGTFRAAIDRLDHLADTGITAIEIMPIAHFAGDRGWGYDGVLLYAPHPAYGTPDDFKALVDAAHARGLMVLLDVVYNHFGPEGNYLGSYAPEFFHPEQHTPWGAAIAYDRAPVRRFFVENALYWVREFRLDGLRLDAIDYVRDAGSEPEILVEIAATVRAAFPERHLHLTTEDNRNIVYLHERGDDGAMPLYTAEWNDDLHNAAHVIATGEVEGYYADFAHEPVGKFARALAEGFAFQGEKSRVGTPRGVASGHLPPVAFIDFLQNHDQIGNRAFGERLTTLARPQGMMRALTAILLLSPHIPLMFMGDEWGETRPFAFFTDFEGELAEAVREGRRREFRHFMAFEDPAMRQRIPDPNAIETFEASRIDWQARDSARGKDWLHFVSGLLHVRQQEIVPLLRGIGGQVGKVVMVEQGALAIHWRLAGGDLYLRANLDDVPREVPLQPGRVLLATTGGGTAVTALEQVILLPPTAVVFTIDRSNDAPTGTPGAHLS